MQRLRVGDVIRYIPVKLYYGSIKVIGIKVKLVDYNADGFILASDYSKKSLKSNLFEHLWFQIDNEIIDEAKIIRADIKRGFFDLTKRYD